MTTGLYTVAAGMCEAQKVIPAGEPNAPPIKQLSPARSVIPWRRTNPDHNSQQSLLPATTRSSQDTHTQIDLLEEREPLQFHFTFYKPKGSWQLFTISYDENADVTAGNLALEQLSR